MSVNATDIYGSTSTVVASRLVRIWDCAVAVSGTLYDSSGVQNVSCFTGSGYSLPYGNVDFRDPFVFTGLGSSRPMTVSSPTYTSTLNPLVWGGVYTPSFPPLDAYPPSNQYIRVITMNVGTTSCTNSVINLGTNINSSINNSLAYIDSPRVQIDFTTTRFSDGWFQTLGAGVGANGAVNNTVPLSCPVESGCTPATSASRGQNTNGLVSGSMLTGLASCANCLWASPNDWSGESATVSSKDGHGSLYNQFIGKGVGIEISGNTTWSNVLTQLGGKGIVFVQGDLTIDTTNTLANGDFLLVSVAGNIVVDPAVPISVGEKISGIFITGGNFSATGTSPNQLVVEGSIYAKNNIVLTRGYNVRSQNNSSPAVIVIHRPDLLFSMPSEIRYTLSGWKEGSR